jgi:hypothetical protein
MSKLVKVRLNQGDQEVEAEGIVVGALTSHEPWGTAELEDGTRIRFRQVIARVVRVDDPRYRTEDGEPRYVLEQQLFAHFDVNPKLVAKPAMG